MTHSLITGGSSGIGLAVASILLKRGERVSIVAREVKRLEQARDFLLSDGAESDKLFLQSCDVEDYGELRLAVANAVNAHGMIDVLVANAGIVIPNVFDEQSGEDFGRQIGVNLIGVANSVRAVYGAMKDRSSGKIAIVSSGAGLLGIPGYTAYCASKSGLRGFAEALRLEAASHGISVIVCYPPDTDTPQYRQEIRLRPDAANQFLGASTPAAVNAIARKIVEGLDHKRKRVYFSWGVASLAIFGGLVEPVLQGLYFKKLRNPTH